MLRIALSVFILSLLLQWVAGWWTIAIAAIIMTYVLARNAKEATLGSFLAIFVLWSAMALFFDLQNGGILASRIGNLLGAASLSSVLFLISGVLGGLVAALSGYVGYQLKQVVRPTPPPSENYQH